MKKNILLSLLVLPILLSCNYIQNANKVSDYNIISFNQKISGQFRDWQKYPAITDTDAPGDIIALGDVHGDYDSLLKLLQGAGIISALTTDPEKVEWIGGNRVFVCTGDMIDKWTNSIKVLKLFQTISNQSLKSGGKVIVTLGNHEAEFLANPDNSKTVEFINELKAAGINPLDVASGKHPLGNYLRSLPVAARIGKWFFVHAGNTSGRSFVQLNNDLQNGMNKDGFASPVLIDDNSLLEAKLSPVPWWETSGNPQTTLNSYVFALGSEHIVMGHQPGSVRFSDGTMRKRGQIYQKFGKIFLIDVGMSAGVDSNPGVLLRIHNNGNNTLVSAIYTDGKEQPLWNN